MRTMKRCLSAAGLGLLSLNHPAAAADAMWITNVMLVSPEKMELVEPGSVLVQDGRIVSVTRGARQTAPAGAAMVDGKGYFLSPGLIDSHVHLHGVPGMSPEMSEQKKGMADEYFRQLPRSFLYYGYTTVIDLALAERAVIDNFNAAPLHPDVVHCGEPLVLANGYPMSYFKPAERFEKFPNFLYDPAQAAAIPARYRAADYTAAAGVARVKAGGGICVKTHYETGFGKERKLPVMSRAMFGAVRAAASEQGLVLVTHANTFEAQQFAVAGEADVIAHGLWKWGRFDKHTDLPADMAAMLDQMVARGTGFQPTMQVLYGLRAVVEPGYLANPAMRKVVPASLAAWFATPQGTWFKTELAEGEADSDVLKGFEAPLRRARLVLAYLAARDANILLGTDTPSSPTYGNLPGLNGYLEMQRMHQAGLSLAQVFKAATINNARTFKLDKEVGTIEPGKVANLVLMKKSPLQDIAAYDSIEAIWVRGKMVRRAALAAPN
jgi:imidazolonepropionase-like amidohydrolase